MAVTPWCRPYFVLIFTASCSTVPPQNNAPPPSTPRVAETSNPQYDQKQLAIARLMEQAHQAMDDQRLTEPEDQSALFFYRAILQIDPSHQGAKEGIHQIVERYLTWALEAIDDLAFTKASLWLERAALADPKAPLFLQWRNALHSNDLYLDARSCCRSGSPAPLICLITIQPLNGP